MIVIFLVVIFSSNLVEANRTAECASRAITCRAHVHKLTPEQCEEGYHLACNLEMKRKTGTGEWIIEYYGNFVTMHKHPIDNVSCGLRDNEHLRVMCKKTEDCEKMSVKDVLRMCNVADSTPAPLPPIDTCPSGRRPPTKCDDISYPGVYQDSYLYCGRTIEKNENGHWFMSKSDSSFTQSLPLTWCQVNSDNQATVVCFGDNCSKNWSVLDMMTICGIPEQKSRAIATNNQQLNDSDSLINLLDETSKGYEVRLGRLKRQLDLLEKEIQSAQNSFAADSRIPRETYTNIHLTLNAWRIAVSMMKHESNMNDNQENLISIPKNYFIILVIAILSLVLANICWRRYANRHKRVLKHLLKTPQPLRPHGAIDDSVYESLYARNLISPRFSQ